MSKVLSERGLWLAVVSSKFLEANKVVKAIMRRLSGSGGGASFAHLPLVQGLKRCVAARSPFSCAPSGIV
jgi:hypothetical protein